MNDTTTATAKPRTEAPRNAKPAGSTPGRGDRRRNERGPRRPRRPREPRARSEFDNAILGIRRVTRVVAGGRRFSFSVTLVIGNGRGQVGVGLGKAADTALAIEKASKNAKRHLLHIPLTEDHSIGHEVQAKYAAAQVLLIPAPGKGLKAGSAVRTVLELAGIRNVSGKILSRSKNPLNNARATVAALRQLKPIKSKKKDDKKEDAAKRERPVARKKEKGTEEK